MLGLQVNLPLSLQKRVGEVDVIDEELGSLHHLRVLVTTHGHVLVVWGAVQSVDRTLIEQPHRTDLRGPLFQPLSYCQRIASWLPAPHGCKDCQVLIDCRQHERAGSRLLQSSPDLGLILVADLDSIRIYQLQRLK